MIIIYGWHTYTECTLISKSDESVVYHGIRRHIVYELTIDRMGLEISEVEGISLIIPEGYAEIKLLKQP